MATAVIMPKQGQSVESCIISKWHKKPGDTVKEGDILFSYETDKASFEEEAKIGGTLLAVFYEEGDDVECLLNVCVIGEAGEDYSAFMPDAAETQQILETTSAALAQQQNAPAIVITEQKDETVKISPRARKLADKTGADISRAIPTGANARIMERDIRAVALQGIRHIDATQEDMYKQTEIDQTKTNIIPDGLDFEDVN
ncbi:MAG: 2-oxo acid dehydrogenase subunit E2, partial [Clostridiaceae bacterium]|nr:2-oxo acid dehydrogenase subunit E2 [Clostridiaceae bacterium]